MRQPLKLEPLEPRIMLSGATFGPDEDDLTLSMSEMGRHDLTLAFSGEGQGVMEVLDSTSDEVLLRRDAADVSCITFVGEDDVDDNLRLALNAVPASGQLTIVYSGGRGGFDCFGLVGNSSLSVEYAPIGADGGQIGLRAGEWEGAVTFSGLEPVTVSGVASYTHTTGASQDEILIDSPEAGQNRISGTLDGTAFETVTFSGVTGTFTLECGAGDDLVQMEGPLVGAEDLEIHLGAGSDSFEWADPSGSVTVHGDDGDDQCGVGFVRSYEQQSDGADSGWLWGPEGTLKEDGDWRLRYLTTEAIVLPQLKAHVEVSMADTGNDLTLNFGGVDLVDLQVVDSASGDVLDTHPVEEVGWITFVGEDDVADRLGLDLGAVPESGQLDIIYSGGTGASDRLDLVGSASLTVEHLFTGAGAGEMSPGTDQWLGWEGPVSFTGVESFTVSDVDSYTYVARGAQEISVDSPEAGQNRLSGTAGGTALGTVVFSGVEGTFTLRGERSVMFSESSLDGMKSAGVPEDVVEKLDPIVDEAFATLADLEQRIEELVTGEEFVDHGDTMLGYVNYLAEGHQVQMTGPPAGAGDFQIVRGPRSFTFTGDSFESMRSDDVPNSVVGKLNPLKNQWLATYEELEQGVDDLLAMDEFRDYGDTILGHAHTGKDSFEWTEPDGSVALHGNNGPDRSIVGFVESYEHEVEAEGSGWLWGPGGTSRGDCDWLLRYVSIEELLARSFVTDPFESEPTEETFAALDVEVEETLSSLADFFSLIEQHHEFAAAIPPLGDSMAGSISPSTIFSRVYDEYPHFAHELNGLSELFDYFGDLSMEPDPMAVTTDGFTSSLVGLVDVVTGEGVSLEGVGLDWTVSGEEYGTRDLTTMGSLRGAGVELPGRVLFPPGSLGEMAGEGVPQDVLDKLVGIDGEPFASRAKMEERVRDLITDGEFAEYGKTILRFSEEDSEYAYSYEATFTAHVRLLINAAGSESTRMAVNEISAAVATEDGDFADLSGYPIYFGVLGATLDGSGSLVVDLSSRLEDPQLTSGLSRSDMDTWTLDDVTEAVSFFGA